MIVRLLVLVLLVAVIATAVWRFRGKSAEPELAAKTVDDRVTEFGDAVRQRLTPHFAKAGIAYPPEQIALIGLKDRRVLQLYASDRDAKFKLIRTYPVLAASGHPGPKLREGDRQVPEGVYEVESLNPNSRFHLALRVNYPNAFDREQAAREGRTDLGGDIMIHGGDASIGCLAMGDEAAEDLFVVAALANSRKVPVIIAPTDFRERTVAPPADAPPWTESLYREVRDVLAQYPESNRRQLSDG